MSGIPDIHLNHERFHSPPRFHRGPAPMAIPRAQEQHVPPPLPPPSFLSISPNHDPGWQWGNDPNGSDFGRPASVKPGSSLLGGAPARTFGGRAEKENDAAYHHHIDWARRGSSISTATTSTVTGNINDMAESGSLTPSDDGSMSRPTSNYRLHGERHLEQRTLEASSNTYDKQLLSRIGGPNGPPTPKRTSLSYSSGNAQETAQLAHAESERRNSQLLRPLSMPERQQQQSSLDSPASSRWPSSGAVSPGFTGFWPEGGPTEHSRFQPSRHSSITFEDSISQRGSYDASMYAQEDFVEDSHMRDLHIQDRLDRSPGSDARGQKRRASSPPRDLSREDRSSVSSASTHSEAAQRRNLFHQPRISPISRLHPNNSSISSASSYGPRHGSLGSSLGGLSIPSTAATSYSSGRISPGGLSPAFDPTDSRFSAQFKGLSPNSAIAAPHQRTLSQSSQGPQPIASADSAPQSRHHSVSQIHGVYICECCPKKPKKFDTEDELRLHESEKQYTCAYCPNRFKNKNEAERHQNSLHLRRHSWSCAALAGVEAAFHASSAGSGHDVCGYCGEEFPNPPQWDLRAEHLNHVHKFGECNQAKKFFRADHFRQHLKHSHQGTSGKWTNMLELACMKDEPLPEKRVTQSSQAAPPAVLVSANGSPPSTQPANTTGVASVEPS
ncbi:hypothetical protein CB0940_04914 [Cercospora beticola]|uniref:C2H2-type domain-containing protein n=1 Tax=Cercospora beticola TaxID=122368 RepID=A0A2G5HKC6_CERBT|nr:hypothetical protein CB0940_04914 [Cercospora beticola]PIA92672.1 hypothetical protein CB0940_04914 [Cercospora beticola]WPB02199.1 hypothetical protein RHO25_006833 [Cercospora beticola]CAK1362941.1 unnamed protein product [Cercospora beticola]